MVDTSPSNRRTFPTARNSADPPTQWSCLRALRDHWVAAAGVTPWTRLAQFRPKTFGGFTDLRSRMGHVLAGLRKFFYQIASSCSRVVRNQACHKRRSLRSKYLNRQQLFTLGLRHLDCSPIRGLGWDGIKLRNQACHKRRSRRSKYLNRPHVPWHAPHGLSRRYYSRARYGHERPAVSTLVSRGMRLECGCRPGIGETPARKYLCVYFTE